MSESWAINNKIYSGAQKSRGADNLGDEASISGILLAEIEFERNDLKMAAARFDQIMLLNRKIVAFGPPATVLDPVNLLAAYGGGEMVDSKPFPDPKPAGE